MIWIYLLLLSPAFARDVQLCAQWTPNVNEAAYLDNDGVDGNGDGIVDNDKQDRLTTNAPIAAHGLYAVAQSRETASSAWTTGWTGYLEVGGTTGGCTDLFAAETSQFGTTNVRLAVWSMSQPDGQPLLPVYDDDVTLDLGTIETLGQSVPVWSPDRVNIDLGSGDSRFDIAIILAWALHRESGGITLGSGWQVFNCPNPGDEDDCLASGAGGGGMLFSDTSLYVDDATNVRRILHELGHALTATLTNHWDSTYVWANADNTDSECPVDLQPGNDGSGSHYTNSDEATSAAIVEGIATYYAAQTVNRVDEGDCYVAQKPYDWDHSGSIVALEDQAWYSCESRPAAGITTLGARDYWSDVCGYPSLPAPYLHSIATEYDWTRGFWDLDTDWGYDFSDMAMVLYGAYPNTWTASPICTDLVGGCDDRPYIRMQEGADTRDGVKPGFEAAWMDECSNGICR